MVVFCIPSLYSVLINRLNNNGRSSFQWLKGYICVLSSMCLSVGLNNCPDF